MQERLKRTQLYEAHLKTAKLIPFAGFEMPIYYKDITPEHMAVRNSVGIFDISHMGRVIVEGTDSERFLNHVITNDVSTLPANAALYSVMCTDAGGIVDDFVVYRLEKEKFLVVFNASNRQKDFDWFIVHLGDLDARIRDVSDEVAMLAVQGPSSEKTLQKISVANLDEIGRFKCEQTRLSGIDVFLSRTGYTGEDGFEIFVWNSPLEKPDNAVNLWKETLDAGKAFGIEPCGLGSRDTLRLEAGLCLYGNDIDETVTPLEAGLGFVVKFQKESFIGKNSLLRQKAEGIKRKRIGIKMLEAGIPRPHFELFAASSERIGQLTSGTFSPLLKTGIGMGYSQVTYAQNGTLVEVAVRQKRAKAEIKSFPMYDPDRYGYKRQAAQ